jgi:hypothetical protein
MQRQSRRTAGRNMHKQSHASKLHRTCSISTKHSTTCAVRTQSNKPLSSAARVSEHPISNPHIPKQNHYTTSILYPHPTRKTLINCTTSRPPHRHISLPSCVPTFPIPRFKAVLIRQLRKYTFLSAWRTNHNPRHVKI